MTETAQSIPGDLPGQSRRSNWQAGIPEGPAAEGTTEATIQPTVSGPPKTRRYPCADIDGSHLSDVHVARLSPTPDEFTSRLKTIYNLPEK